MNDMTKFLFTLNGTVDDSNSTSNTLELVGLCASRKRSSIGRDLILFHRQKNRECATFFFWLTCQLRVDYKARSVGAETVIV